MEKFIRSKMSAVELHHVRSPVISTRSIVFDIFMLLYTVVTYLFDIGFDIYVAFRLRIGYSISSFIVLIIQSVAAALASWKWYENDRHELSVWECVMHVLLLAPVLRCGRAIYYACKTVYATSDVDRARFKKLLLENMAKIALLSVLEGYLEAGPQLVIQIGEFARRIPSEDLANLEWHRLVSIMLSVISLAMIMQNYHASIRRDQDDTGHISILGRLIMFFWHLMIVVSRITVLVTLMVINPISMVACIVHILVFFIYLQKYGPLRNFDNSESWHQLLLLSFSCIYIFTAIPVREGPTRKLYSIVYSVFVIEGILVFIVGYFLIDWEAFVFIYPSVTLLSFILGLVFMTVYYKFLHPSKSRRNANEEIECNSFITPQPIAP